MQFLGGTHLAMLKPKDLLDVFYLCVTHDLSVRRVANVEKLTPAGGEEAPSIESSENKY